jgi:hypothetical protein
MNWLARILNREQPARYTLSVRAIQFDPSGWTYLKNGHDLVEWCNADGDRLRAQVHGEPIDVSWATADLDSLRAFYRRKAARHHGGIVIAEIVQAGGVRLVKVITKWERRPAYAYRGQLIIPFKDAKYTITMDSIEQGVTGKRDALVTFHLAERGELEIESPIRPGEPGRVKGWFQDPYDFNFSGPILHSMSDDDRLDRLFPNHPLSKIRASLARIQDTLSIDSATLKGVVRLPGGMMGEQGGDRPRCLLPSSTVASLYLAFGSALLEAGRFNEAERLLGLSLSELERDAGDNDLLVARHLLCLGLAHENQGKNPDAETALLRCWTVSKAKLGHDHPVTAQAMLNLARVYIHLGKHDEAEPLFQMALTLFEGTQLPGSNIAVALNGLGLVHNARGLYAQALPLFERALGIFQAVHGPEFTDCATVLRNMAVSLHKIGEHQKAEEALERARQIDRTSVDQH